MTYITVSPTTLPQYFSFVGINLIKKTDKTIDNNKISTERIRFLSARNSYVNFAFANCTQYIPQPCNNPQKINSIFNV